MSAISEAIRQATDYLTKHPNEARSTDSRAVATVGRGLRVTVSDPGGRTVETDMATSVGGTDTAPSPGWLFRAALASCDATLIAMHAATLGIELDEIEVAVDSESDDLGILGIDATVPAGPLSMRTQIKVRAKDVDESSLRELVDWAVAHCPVCDAAKRSLPVTVEIDAG